jgi:CheY-like chemotaxis protein
MLKKLRLNVVAAANGEEALSLMENQTVDGMLLDIALGPGISGDELMLKFRQDPRFKTIPIIAVTASWEDVLKKLVKIGFNDYLEKPYTFEQLCAILEKYHLLNPDVQ